MSGDTQVEWFGIITIRSATSYHLPTPYHRARTYLFDESSDEADRFGKMFGDACKACGLRKTQAFVLFYRMERSQR
jgi:hypothetical protein